MSSLAYCIRTILLDPDDLALVRKHVEMAGNEEAGVRAFLAELQGELEGLRQQLVAQGFDVVATRSEEPPTLIATSLETSKTTKVNLKTPKEKGPTTGDLFGAPDAAAKTPKTPKAKAGEDFGAPVGTLIYVDGVPLNVEGHRYTSEGWFVVTSQGDVSYLDAKDEQGNMLYEGRIFTPPVEKPWLDKLSARALRDGYKAQEDDKGTWHVLTPGLASASSGPTEALAIRAFNMNPNFRELHNKPEAQANGRPEVMGNIAEAPPFYSALLRTVEGLKMAKAPAAQWLATIKNQQGVKQEELDWLGVADWLNAQSGPVTKEALAEFIRANQVQVQEVVKGGEKGAESNFYGWRVEPLSNGQWTYGDPESMTLLDDEAIIEAGFDLFDTREEAQASLDAEKSVPTKFAQYQLPGGKNYRELLLTLPDNQGEKLNARRREIEALGASATQEQKQEWADIMNRLKPDDRDVEGVQRFRARPEFRGSHWVEPNVFAHVRFNEREADGKRVLFIEEIQSDWHQKGRRMGYRGDNPDQRQAQAAERVARYRAPYGEMMLRHGYLGFDSLTEATAAISREGAANWEFDTLADRDLAVAYIEARREQIGAGNEQSRVPNAPFKTSWPEVALKRMIRWAAENGFDSIAWTPGDVQNKRYKLSRVLDGVNWTTRPHGGKFVTAAVKGSGFGSVTTNADGKIVIAKGALERFADKKLEDVFGKDVAAQIMNEQTGDLEGDGLDIGGTGMRGFYDKMLVDTANKLGKKFGAKVGRAAIGTFDDSLVDENTTAEEAGVQAIAHTLPITPDMRRAALGGMPLFDATPAPAITGTRQQIEAAGREVERLTRQMLGRKVKTLTSDVMPGFISPDYTAAYGESTRTIYITMRAAHDIANNVGHEALHAMRSLGLITDGEWTAMVAMAKKHGFAATKASEAIYRREYVERFGLSEADFRERMDEEAVARLFGDYVATREKVTPFVRRAIDKLREWADAVMTAIGKAGVDVQARQFMREAYRGDIGRRTEGSAQGALVAGATDDEVSPTSSYTPLHKFIWRSTKTLASDARDYVLRQGEKLGNIEVILAFDRVGIILADGHGPAHGRTVDLPDSIYSILNRAGSDVVVHHNHPHGGALSLSDLVSTAHVGAGSVWAHGKDGSYRATAAPEIKAMGVQQFGTLMRREINTMMEPIVSDLQRRTDAGAMSADDGNFFYYHALNLALHKAGVIDYFTNAPYGTDARIEAAIDQSAGVIKGIFSNVGIQLRGPARSVRYRGDVGILPEGDRGNAGPQGQGATAPGRGRGDRGFESGAQAGPGQGGLILGNAPDGGSGGGRPPPTGMAIDSTGEKELEDLAGNINLRRLNTPDDIKEALKQVAAEAQGFITERRGVVSNDQTAALAAELGMTVDELMKRETGQAFNAHQIFAARVMLLKSAERVKRLAKEAKDSNSLSTLAEFQKAVVRHRAIQEQVAGMTAEAGRALQQFNMIAAKDSLRAMDALLNGVRSKKASRNAKLGGPNEEARELADMINGLDDPAQLGKFINDMRKATVWDMIREAWINALLSGLRTHAANILSNTLTALWQVPETFVAETIGRFHGGDKVQAGEATARLIGLIEGTKEGLIAGAHHVIHGEAFDAVSKAELLERAAIPGKLGSVIRTPSRLLEAEDQVFKAINYRAEINAQAVRIAMKEGRRGASLVQRVAELRANPTQKMQNQAHQAALYQTFQNKLGKKGQMIMNLREAVPLGWVIMPFIRTPANILKYAAERTPLGLLMKPVRDNLSGANGAAARDTQLARLALGSALMVAVVAMVAAGHITGGPPDDREEEKLLRATGWQPYSIRVGDTYYSYQRFDPLALVVGLAADSVYLAKHMTEAELTQAAHMLIMAVVNNLKEKTWISGLISFGDAFFSGEAWKMDAWGRRLGASVVPAGVAQYTQSTDPYIREVRSLTDAIKSRVPGWSETLTIKRDVFGERIKRGGALGPDIASPVFTSQVNDSPIVRELFRLGYFPQMPDRVIKGHRLTSEQYDRYVELSGKDASARLTAIIGGSGWSRMDEVKQEEKIRDVFTEARRRARIRLFQEWPELRKKAESK